MAALGIHHDEVEGQRRALPLVPGADRTAGDIGRVAPFQHQTLDAGGAGAVADRRQVRPALERNQRRKVENQRRGPRPGFQPRPSLLERQRPQVLVALEQNVVDPDEGWRVRDQLRAGPLPPKPLLEIGERRRIIRHGAPNQQFAVDRAREIETGDHVRKALADIVAGARIEATLAVARDRLDAHPVPLPLGEISLRVERGQLLFVERIRKHRRPEAGAGIGVGLGAPTLQPREKPGIGRREAVPDLLDLGHGMVERMGERRLGEPRGDADTQSARRKLQERPASVRVEHIEPFGQEVRRPRPVGDP